jgi:hypothetical protein
MLLGDIDKDRVGVGDYGIAVLQHRNLAEGIEREKGGALVLGGSKIDFDNLRVDANQRKEEASAMGMARKWMNVEFQISE